MTRLLLSLFFSLTCQGQLPMLPLSVDIQNASSGPQPTDISGMALRLKASDLALASTVTSWTDEIHNRQFTNSTASNKPTNSNTLGVWFLAGNFLSNNIANGSAWAWNQTQQVFIAYQAWNPANYGSIFGSAAGENLMGYSTGPNNFGTVQGTQNKWINSYPISAVNYVIISAGGLIGNDQAYSNNVAALTFTSGGLTFDMMGVNQPTHVDGFQGYVKEVVIWTNSAALTTLQVSNLYIYAHNQGYW